MAGLDGTWSYDVLAYDSLLLKAALVLLTPLGVTVTSLNESTDPTRRAAHSSVDGNRAGLSSET